MSIVHSRESRRAAVCAGGDLEGRVRGGISIKGPSRSGTFYLGITIKVPQGYEKRENTSSMVDEPSQAKPASLRELQYNNNHSISM
eukprot:scaffold20360_cov78-Skeletonema_marinoi.AAC.2